VPQIEESKKRFAFLFVSDKTLLNLLIAAALILCADALFTSCTWEVQMRYDQVYYKTVESPIFSPPKTQGGHASVMYAPLVGALALRVFAVSIGYFLASIRSLRPIVVIIAWLTFSIGGLDVIARCFQPH
jgi:hypothetical protein